jgi:hypothetical protein
VARSAITIDQVPKQVAFRTLILTGRNSPDIATITVTGVPVSVVQPTTVTWRAELRLSAGQNRITVGGIDVGGNVTESLVFTVDMLALIQRSQRPRNPLDEHGTLLAVPRLPAEKNLPYLNRLKDTGGRPSDTTVRGVTYGASRGIGLRVRPAVQLRSPRDIDSGEPRMGTGSVQIGTVFFDIRSTHLLTDDCRRIEPATQEIGLSQIPASSDVRIVTLQGDEIPRTLYVVDVHRQTVRFLTHALNGVEVRALYAHVVRISLLGRTLTDLKTVVEAVTDAAGQSLLELTILVSGLTPAEHLIPTKGRIHVIGFVRVLEMSPLRVRELHDYDFQQAQLNADGHAIATKLSAWAQQVNTQARVIWDATFLGESFWEPLGEEPRLGVLPHLSDAARGHWRCRDASDATRFTLRDFRAFGGICPVDGTPLEYHGILPLEFQSGVGTGDDLKVRAVVAVPTEG